MIQTSQCTNFTDETSGQVRLGAQVSEQNLHRLSAVRNNIAHAIHTAHAANTNKAYNLVVGDPLTNFKPHKVTSRPPLP